MTHLKKITLTSFFIFCVSMTTQVMADGMPENWGEMVENARKIAKQNKLRHLLISPLVTDKNDNCSHQCRRRKRFTENFWKKKLKRKQQEKKARVR